MYLCNMKKYIECSYLPKGYKISLDGEILSKYGNVLKDAVSNSGYRFVNINNKGYFIHRALAFSFIPNLENKEQVNHIDGIKNNNSISNLEWCTRSENVKHAYDIGLKNYRPLHYKNKFGSDHNRSISIIINGIEYNGYSEASRKLGINITTIYYRVNSNSEKWMHFQFK